MNGVGGQDGVKKCAAFLREKETNKRETILQGQYK
jgi:hypothetical protein